LTRGTTKTLSVGCIILSIFLCGLALFPQIVQAANTATATITVGGIPFGVAITPDGKYAYVPSTAHLSVISTATNKVTATLDIRGSNVVAITPDGKYAYVLNAIQDPKNGNQNLVSVISIATNKVTATITLGGASAGLAITPNGEYAYVTEEDIVNTKSVGMVSVINTATNTVTTKVTVEGAPLAVAITPNGEYAYVTSSGSVASFGSPQANDMVSVIDITTNTVTAKVTVGIGSQSVTITPDGEYAYVANAGNDSVSVINTATNTVTTTITGLSHPYDVALTPNGEYAYVTEQDFENYAGRASVIKTATNAVTATVALVEYPYAEAITPDGAYVYIANGVNGTVSVIDTATNTVLPAASASTTSESSSQWLIITILVAVIIVLVAVIIVKKKHRNVNSASAKPALALGGRKQASAETRRTNQANTILSFYF
jgi:YVTN family beta-propeller protein